MPVPTSKIIELSHISHRYDDREVLSDINLTVERGDFIAITGPNGGGKSTLLKIMLRLLKPSHGAVTYFDNGSLSQSISVGYLPQKNMIDSRFPITVREVVASGLLAPSAALRRPSAAERSRIDAILEQMGIADVADKTIGQLSGGMMQRTLLGRALVAEPELLVLDEPLSYVDKQFVQRIYSTIASIAPSATIVLVSHEMTGIAPLANRHLIIDRALTLCHSSHHHSESDCSIG